MAGLLVGQAIREKRLRAWQVRLHEAASAAPASTGPIDVAADSRDTLIFAALGHSIRSLDLPLANWFGGGMALAFTKLRPLFRERAKLNAEVIGRLTETLGGIRVVKSYVAERREQLVFARGAHRLLRNVATTMTGVSAVGAFASLIVGAIGAVLIVVGGGRATALLPRAAG